MRVESAWELTREAGSTGSTSAREVLIETLLVLCYVIKRFSLWKTLLLRKEKLAYFRCLLLGNFIFFGIWFLEKISKKDLFPIAIFILRKVIS